MYIFSKLRTEARIRVQAVLGIRVKLLLLLVEAFKVPLKSLSLLIGGEL